MTVRREQRNKQATWVVDFWWQFTDGSRERIRRKSPINTRKAAIDYENKLKSELLQKDIAPPKQTHGPAFGTFADTFMERYAKVNNKPSEYQSKRSILDQHLIPFLGKTPLRKLRLQDVEDFKALQSSKGLKAKTINNQLTVLRRILAEAHFMEYMGAPPLVRPLKVDEPDFDFLTPGEAMQLVAGAEPGLWRTMIYTALRAGLRQGELLGLDRDCVNFSAGVINVRRNYVRGEMGSPKSSKPRAVAMPATLQRALEEWLRSHDSRHVFHIEGHRIEKGQCKWPLWRACKTAELRRIGWHVLRHSYASHLVMAGASIVAVKELLGHSDIKMTMRYAHLAPDNRSEAAALLDRTDEQLTGDL